MPSAQGKKIIVGMSGGVDSSVSAYLLQRQGYKVEGLFMKNWEEDDKDNYCPARIELEFTQQVCDSLKIPLHIENFSEQYWDNVFSVFLEEIKMGRTPNPDIICNKEIKFKSFLYRALELGADYIATGHYAKNFDDQHKMTYLAKAKDQNKDQTYFLHSLNQKQLSYTKFPLSESFKSEVRELAQELGFTNYNKKDSTGICFIGEKKFQDFLKNFIPAQKGEILDTDHKVIGEHSGVMFYTIGQRKGLRLGGMPQHEQAPWYVISKNLANNQLIVSQNKQLLYKKHLSASQCHWINEPPQVNQALTAKVRYRQSESSCTINKREFDSSGLEIIKVEFEQKQMSITPGQYVVFYNEDICLGGAIIDDSW